MIGRRKEKSNPGKPRVFRSLFLCLFFLATSLLLLEAFLRLGAFLFFLEEEKANRISLSRRESYVILCLGESMTAGGGISSYTRQLEEILNHSGLRVPVAVVNRGLPSGNTGMIVARLGEDLATYRPDMVIVMMGVMDLLQPLDPRISSGDRRWRRLEENLRIVELGRDAIKFLAGFLAGSNPIDGRPSSRPEIDPVRTVNSFRAERANIFLRRGDRLADDAGDGEENWSRAVRMFQRALEIDPELPRAWLRLGVSRREAGDLQGSLDALERARSYPETAHQALIEIGNCWRLADDWRKADAYYRLALDEKPQDAAPYLELSRLARRRGDEAAAAEHLARGLVLEPFNRLVYLEIEKQLLSDNSPEALVRVLREARLAHPDLLNFAILEAKMLATRGREEEAEAIYRGILKEHPEAFWVHTALGNMLQRKGDPNRAAYHYREADRWSRRNTGTAANYRRLARTVLDAEIELVCVQYPLLDVGELEEMLRDIGEITLVDNEEIFRRAVENDSYSHYFHQRFPGQPFGHCNARGNRLLAENIVAALLSGPLKPFLAPSSLPRPAEKHPSIGGRSNLLAAAEVRVTVIADGPEGNGHHRLGEEDSDRGRSRFLERSEKPVRVRVDFGEDNPRAVTIIGSRHPEDPDHVLMGEAYFRGATLLGSNDAEDWALIATPDHLEYPGEDSWRLWHFPNTEEFRYYQLELPGTEASELDDYPRQVNELGMFE